MIKNILILGPLWRNKKILNFLRKDYSVISYNKKINVSFIKKQKIDILITSGYPFLVKKDVLKLLKIKINLHNSYLPFGRGIMPNVWSFYEDYTPGISIHQLDNKFDTGKIYLQKKIKFKNIKNHTLKSTHDYLLKSLEEFFIKNCKDIFNFKIKPYRQDKYFKLDRYHTRLESENLMAYFKKKWNTKILEIIKFKKDNKMKPAILGGSKTRITKMPPRFSFGKKENFEIKKMLKYYNKRGEDPKYSGEWEKKYCKRFSTFMGGGYSDAVATGTGAIYVAMKALEIKKNSDVIISPVTCSGNFSCITEQGLNPILVDSKPNSYNTSLSEIKKKITKKTKLIQLTHVGGEPVSDIKSIADFAKKKKILLLEDCSQAIGAKVEGKYVGTFGDIAAFSTMYRKNLAANSSGGIIYTKNYERFKKVLAYADRGKVLWKENLDFRDPGNSLFPALNWNSDEFTCAIGLANLNRLTQTNKKRKKFLENFLKLMKSEKIISCSALNYHKGYSPFFFPLKYNSNILKISQKKFTDALVAEGIPVGTNYGCLVTTWKWTNKFFKKKYSTPNALNTRDNCFHLYLNENYKNKEAVDIVNAIKKIENYYRK